MQILISKESVDTDIPFSYSKLKIVEGIHTWYNII
jgi:hypothetical protein